MKNTTDNILARNLKKAIYEDRLSDIDLPDGKNIDGPFYHGTCMLPDEGVFSTLKSGMSDFEALWVASDEWVSETFAASRCGTGRAEVEDSFPAVYKIMQNVTNAIPIDQNLVKDLMFELDVNDPRELIPHLDTLGYDAWVAMGSVSERLYTDIAIFSSEIEIEEMKMFIDGEWTDYFNPENFKEKMNGKMKSDHLDRFTRPLAV